MIFSDPQVQVVDPGIKTVTSYSIKLMPQEIDPRIMNNRSPNSNQRRFFIVVHVQSHMVFNISIGPPFVK